MATTAMTNTHSITVTGTNVREVADCTWQEIHSIYEVYGMRFPYDMPKLRLDLGQIYLWDMTDGVRVQFYDKEKVERLSYEFVPRIDPAAVHTPPGTFPRFEIPEGLSVRVVARYTTTKPEEEVREFFAALGWLAVEPLTRTGQGTTERYGAFRSGDFSVTREVYTDLPATTKTNTKEVAP